MKRLTATLLAAAMCMGTFAGCGSNTEETTDNSNAGAAAGETAAATTESQTASAENVHLDALNVYFVPSRDPEEIVTATEPLSDLLKNELAGLGYDVDSVNISVGTTYEAVGEALSAGTADVGFIPGGTYVLYDDGCDVNSGEELTWDDLDSANWSVMSSSSPAGYIYPALWMQDRYGKGITDLSNAVQSDSYASAFARLASGQVDVLVTYADARRDYEENWTSEYGRSASIWEETNVIGVTDPIYNDTVCVSKTSPYMDENLKTAIQTALINIGNTEEGKAVIAIYSHNGYEPAQSSDYDKEREAQKLIQELNAAN